MRWLCYLLGCRYTPWAACIEVDDYRRRGFESRVCVRCLHEEMRNIDYERRLRDYRQSKEDRVAIFLADERCRRKRGE